MKRVTDADQVKRIFAQISTQVGFEIKFNTAYRMSTGEVAYLKGYAFGVNVRPFLLQGATGTWYRVSLNFIKD